VAAHYLTNVESSTAVITNAQTAKREAGLIADLGLELHELP